MPYAVHVVASQGTPLLVVRRRAAQAQLPVVVPALCGVVWDYVRKAHVRAPGRNVAVYLNGQIDIEVGVEVDATAVGEGEVVVSAIPTGAAATATHFGSYNQLGGAHAAILDWCKANQRELAGPSWEVYGHWNDDVTKVRTDVYYLLDSKTPGVTSEKK